MSETGTLNVDLTLTIHLLSGRQLNGLTRVELSHIP